MTASTLAYSQSRPVSGEGAMTSGTCTWPASALEATKIYCGFQPAKIRLFLNDTTSGTTLVILEWFKGMPAGSYLKTVCSASTQLVYSATGGPTVLSDATGHGFTIPAALGVATMITYWEAWR